MSKKKIVTHSAGFHTDDVFAVATLILYLDEEVEVVRSRDPKVWASADYIVDTGNEYSPDKNIFDHHQSGGAGERENGIPYASFGLVWKHFGEKVCGSKEIAENLDRRLVQPIDAGDNGVKTYASVIDNIRPYDIGDIISLYEPTWKEFREVDFDEKFLEAVSLAKNFLLREIKKTQDWVEAEKIVDDEYKNSTDKRLIIINNEEVADRVLVTYSLIKFPEPLYVVFRGKSFDNSNDPHWRVAAVNKDKNTYETRKPLPESWLGKRDSDLVYASSVSEATFCHKNGFTCGATSKTGAIKLAKLALEA
jgi:uncharacterized UPF0160 family protein